MSYDREKKLKRLRNAKKKSRNPYAKGLERREFRQRVAVQEKKLNRRLRDTEIIRMHCDELEEMGDETSLQILQGTNRDSKSVADEANLPERRDEED